MAFFLSIARVVLLSVLVPIVVADSKCQNPRIRREWRALTDDEQAEWVGAVNCLATLPHDPDLVPSVPTNVSLIPPIDTSSSLYDDLVYIHMDLNSQIHFTGHFLPWHRIYLQYFEDTLISRCNYTGATPYWDWTIDAYDVFDSSFFDTSSHGVGGWGDPNNDFQISTGSFKDVIRAYPIPHHIRRNYTIRPYLGDPNAPADLQSYMINQTMTKEALDYVLTSFDGDFLSFDAFLESTNHAGPHIILGGDMAGFCPDNAGPPNCYPGAKWSPNDPLFFLHHAMVDKIWSDWQKRSSENMYSYGGGSVGAELVDPSLFDEFPTGLPPNLSFASQIPGDGLWDVKIWDVIDTQGDTLCYDYA